MAHKKGGGSTRNGRDSNAQRLGVKRFAGEKVKLTAYAPVDGRRKFQGELLGCEGDRVRILQDGAEVEVELANIAKARLVPDYDAILAASKN